MGNKLLIGDKTMAGPRKPVRKPVRKPLRINKSWDTPSRAITPTPTYNINDKLVYFKLSDNQEKILVYKIAEGDTDTLMGTLPLNCKNVKEKDILNIVATHRRF